MSVRRGAADDVCCCTVCVGVGGVGVGGGGAAADGLGCDDTAAPAKRWLRDVALRVCARCFNPVRFTCGHCVLR